MGGKIPKLSALRGFVIFFFCFSFFFIRHHRVSEWVLAGFQGSTLLSQLGGRCTGQPNLRIEQQLDTIKTSGLPTRRGNPTSPSSSPSHRHTDDTHVQKHSSAIMSVFLLMRAFKCNLRKKKKKTTKVPGFKTLMALVTTSVHPSSGQPSCEGIILLKQDHRGQTGRFLTLRLDGETGPMVFSCCLFIGALLTAVQNKVTRSHRRRAELSPGGLTFSVLSEQQRRSTLQAENSPA